MKARLVTLILCFIAMVVLGQGVITRQKPAQQKAKPTVAQKQPARTSTSRTGSRSNARKKTTTRKPTTSRQTYSDDDYAWLDSVFVSDDEEETSGNEVGSSDGSGLVFYYSGGRFVKNGSKWTEYRLEKKTGYWNTYDEVSDDDDYYYISNSQCLVAVPKDNLENDVLINKDNDFVRVYFRAVVGEFNHKDGFFRADYDEWFEYKNSQLDKPFASYTLYSIDDNFYYIKNSQKEIAVPIDDKINNFFIKKNDKWETLYNHK